MPNLKAIHNKIINKTIKRIHAYINDFTTDIRFRLPESDEGGYRQKFDSLSYVYLFRWRRAEDVINPLGLYREFKPHCILTDNEILQCSECPFSINNASREDSHCGIALSKNINETSILTFIELEAILEVKKGP